MIDPTKQPIRVTYQGKQFIVKYLYEQGEEIIKGKYSLRPIKGKTTAYMGDIKSPFDGITAVAYCAMADNFNKKKGRTIATVRLMQMIENREKKILNMR
jgi:hypothetical protein